MKTSRRLTTAALVLVTLLGWVGAAGPAQAADSSISLSPAAVEQGQELTVDYEVATTSPTHWVGLYSTATGDPDGSPGALDWEYVTEASGAVSFTIDTERFPAGAYRAYLLADDGYDQLATPADFTVVEGAPTLQPLVADYTAQQARVGESYRLRVAGLFASTGEATLQARGLPQGLQLHDGVVSGVPTAAGESSVRLTARLGRLTARTTVRIPVLETDQPKGEDLTVISYNTWIGGANVADSQHKQLRAFLSRDADVVTLQEARSEPTRDLARALGWSYHLAGDVALISRYPLQHVSYDGSTTAGAQVVVDAAFDRAVWVWSAHLDYRRYGPYGARDGLSVEQILTDENASRVPQIRTALDHVRDEEAVDPTAPSVFTGDLNTPSHLDWTAATADTHYGYQVEWPVTQELTAAGYDDTYRVAHPDPARDPGTTWSPVFPEPEPQDRIDYIQRRGAELEVLESEAWVLGSEDAGQGSDLWASDHASVATRFGWQGEDERVVEPAPAPTSSTDVRALTWNIYHGGRDDDSTDLANRDRVVEQVAELEPDVFFAVETYGAAETIRTALERAQGREWEGVQITPSTSDGDNLWLFTHLPVERVFEAPHTADVTSFNVGGAVLRLPNGQPLNAFTMWSSYTNPWVGDLIEENAQDVQAGRPPRHPAETVEAADQRQQATVQELLDYVAVHAPDPDAATVIAGDLNTVPAWDWMRAWARCSDHYGLSYRLGATELFTRAGFDDTFRARNRDVCANPGSTWSPRLAMDTPDRIDFAFARGEQIQILESFTVDERLPQHGAGPFPSDHAALLTELRIGPGNS